MISEKLKKIDSSSVEVRMKDDKFLFLDIDGVLNSAHTLGVYNEHLNSEMVRRLNKIVKLTDCFVIISSSWRITNSLQDMQIFLFNQGMTHAHKVVGTTEQLNKERGYEIQKFLDNNCYSRYCILDDESDMLDSQKSCFVKTNWMKGLTELDVQQAILILGQEKKECSYCDGYGILEDHTCTECNMGIKK